MKKLGTFFRKYYNGAKYLLFPAILLLFPLLKADKGIDLADTMYSLTNYEAFGSVDSVWMKLTFLSNVFGHVLTLLPFGHTMLGMRIYTLLFVGVLGVLSYRFFMTKMPAWLAFLASLASLGMCWIPSVILYNYLTYFLLTLGAIFLFRGLAGERTAMLYLAGLCLGLNAFVRFPNNCLQVLLIFGLWYYGILKNASFEEVGKKTLLCIAGYLSGFLLSYLFAALCFGGNVLSRMMAGVFGISAGASDYTLGQMIGMIFDAYLHGFRWGIYMILCTLIGVPFFVLFAGKYLKLRKIVYCLCIPVLFFILYKWGMYNFRYYQKESALQWGAVFLLISLGCDLYMLISKQINRDWKLIAMLSFIVTLITPLGSNNHIWPVLNNLFLIAPVTFWTVYRFARWGRDKLDITGHVPLFSVKAMLAGVVIAFFIQALGVGIFYVFNDGEDGSPVTYRIHAGTSVSAPVLQGMKTNELQAANLSQLYEVLYGAREGETVAARMQSEGLLLYGNIPGLSYALGQKTTLSTSWADLPSYPTETFREELGSMDKSDTPVIIFSKTVVDHPDEADEKLRILQEYMDAHGYHTKFFNDEFVIYLCD